MPAAFFLLDIHIMNHQIWKVLYVVFNLLFKVCCVSGDV
jgi:hypothetical protein